MLVAMLASGCTTVARATPPTSQPAALPATAIASDQRVVAYPHGRWLLYGDGSAALAYGRGVYYEGFFVGEVAESAEGSRLLSGYRAKSSVQGSNPCLSATRP